MTIGKKDIMKMAGIFVVCACAVFVCTLFLNYNLDMVRIRPLLATEIMERLYEALVMTGKVVCAVTGGCLFLTTVVLICFYIRHYIDAHRRELGILKALGYSSLQIAAGFWKFGLSVLLGCGLGYGLAHGIMPWFYAVQNEDHLLPEIGIRFHPVLLLALVAAPALAFALLSVGYGYRKLGCPVLTLLRGAFAGKLPRSGKERPGKERPFLAELQRSILRQRKTLVFFMAFSAFCFGAMVQMSASMDGLSSAMMAVMMLLIGLILAVVTLFLAATTVVRSNSKNIAVMGAFGYSFRECRRAVLTGYRPFAWLGFLVGTVYQYILFKVMVSVVFAGVEGVPEYEFDVPVFLATLAVFDILYELVLYGYARKIGRMSVKEVMGDGE